MDWRYEEDLERERAQRERKKKSKIHKLKREIKNASKSGCKKSAHERHLNWTSESSDSSSSDYSDSSSTTDSRDTVPKYNSKAKDKKKKRELWEKTPGTLKKKEIRKNSRRSRGISISSSDSDSSSTESSCSSEASSPVPSSSPPLSPQCIYGKNDCKCYIINN